MCDDEMTVRNDFVRDLSFVSKITYRKEERKSFKSFALVFYLSSEILCTDKKPELTFDLRITI